MNEIKLCSGCGIELQILDSTQIGYTPKIENDLCQRCFRLKHYGDTHFIDKHGVDSDDVLESVSKIAGKIVLMVDVSDVESTLFRGIRRHLFNRELILVVTKRDLLPKTVSQQKILRVLSERIKEEAIEVIDALLISIYDAKSIENAKKHLLKHAENSNLIVMGYANTGKSSFLNQLLETKFTVSPYANTTLNIQSASFANHLIYDTPGIRMEASFFDGMSAKKQAQYSISKSIKPITYQLKGKQCFFIGDCADVVIESKGEASVTLYFSDQLPIHRSKAENRETYISKHLVYENLKDLDRQNYNLEKGNYDIVIKQLGWISLKGEDFKIVSHSILKDSVIIRKAMI